ncbi:MAG: hypothetical protein COA47_17830 [Robiginitomaculum sp.]|nr:MAG: hypothetical protein COA47_17830 [Robiginitomaculum sp.]
MRVILIWALAVFPLLSFADNSKDFSKSWEGFKKERYTQHATGVWDCVSLRKSDVNVVLSFKENSFIFYNSLNKFVFSLSSAGKNKMVTLHPSGLRALNPIGNTKLADELEFDYVTDIVSFKSSASLYGNFVNYQCVKRI